MALMKFSAGAVVKTAGLGPREIRVVASTPTQDRVGDILEPGGCKLDSYRKNPIVLADHDPSTPVGTARPVVVGDRLEATITFAPAGISAKADEYCGLYKAGVMSAVSVGFNPIKSEPIRGTGGTRFTAWELFEISCVAVPANTEALVVQRSHGASNSGEELARSEARRKRLLEILDRADVGRAAEIKRAEMRGIEDRKSVV